MNNALVACPKCKAGLFEAGLGTIDVNRCPACDSPIEIEVFPALFQRPGPAQSGERILVEGESSCFYHPRKKAAVPCESCGRFLCALCDVELSGRHLCPACLESGKSKGKLEQLQNQRVLYDDVAVALAIYPMIVWPFTIITAPMALYVAFRYWNAPSSLIPRGKARFIVAILLASLQIFGWTGAIFFLVTHSGR
jgi:hypothetical protein